MYPLSLPNATFYRYPENRNFTDPHNLTYAFVMHNYSIDMHVQEFFEINIITAGEGMHYIANRRLPARHGDIFIIPPETSHGYAGGPGFDVCHLLISNRFMEKFLPDLKLLDSFFLLFQTEPMLRAHNDALPHLTLSTEQFALLEPLLHADIQYSASHAPENTVIRNHLTMLLITAFCRFYTANAEQNQLTKQAGTADAENDSAFPEALSLIHEHYYEKITIERLAAAAHLSRSAFLRKFRDICKMPPAAYLTRKRLDAARRLLTQTSLTVSEIALQTGFYDTSHFTRIFRTEYTTTPAEYRRKYQQLS